VDPKPGHGVLEVKLPSASKLSKLGGSCRLWAIKAAVAAMANLPLGDERAWCSKFRRLSCKR